MTAEELIAKAKNRFPVAISYKGRLTSEDMDGTAVYSIRYKGSEVAK